VTGLETTVLAELRKRHLPGTVVVSSFLPKVIMEMKARSAVVPVGVICRHPSQLVEWRRLPVDYVIVHHTLITQRLVRLIHEASRRIFAWTVNRKKDMLRLAGWGVDGIISDDTRLLVSTLG
jgi:glycerophosphoryl diester phosphodiesterase